MSDMLDVSSPESICSYLARNAWQHVGDYHNASVWKKGDAEVLVPFWRTVRDYDRRVMEIRCVVNAVQAELFDT